MIEDILRFITIVELKSITKASQKLYLTQPALSLSLKRLEKATKTKLFFRVGKQFAITKEGEAVYKIGQRIIELWENAKNAKNLINQSSTINIGLFDNAALKLANFFQKQLNSKKTSIEIKIDNSKNLMQDLNLGILDICVCVIDENTQISKNAVLVERFTEELIPVASKKINLKELSKIPFILYKKGSTTRRSIDEAFSKVFVKPKIMAESTSTTFMKGLSLTGGAVALLPKNFISEELKSKKLLMQKLPIKFSRQIGIFIRKEGNLQKSDVILKELAENLN